MKELVLVTGGSGFIASHIILQLLEQGYAVRTTVRSMAKSQRIVTSMQANGITNIEDLSFVEADLQHPEQWPAAMVGVSYVMHVASPTPKLNFKDESEMINPAVNGVLMVLKAARDANVKRVVLTSAYGAICAGHPNQQTPYTEADWSDLSAKNIHPYQKSKTLAEQAAWNFIKTEGQGLSLAAVNPVGVMGPVLSSVYSHSNVQVEQLLNGQVKAVPQVKSGYVDVRDVASLHLLAMTAPQADGERFLATTGETLSMLEVADVLLGAFPQYASRLPQKTIPNSVIKLAATFKPDLRMLATLVGKYADTSNEKAKKLLGWQPRSAADSIIATGQSMIDLGIIK